MTKKIINSLVIVLVGLSGYKIGEVLTSRKYEKRINKEINDIRSYYKIRLNKLYGVKEEKEEKEEKEIVNNKRITDDLKNPKKNEKDSIRTDAIDYSKPYRTNTPDRVVGEPGETKVAIEEDYVDTTKPHIITPEEYGLSEYQTVTLFYTVDKVLTDDDFNQIDNVGIVGGYVLLDQIGIYDADCLYIRDINKGIDYEILLEEREFSKLQQL